MSQPQGHGNRLPVPRSVSGPHFFYKTRAPVLNTADAQVVIDAIRSCRKRPADCHATQWRKNDPVFKRHRKRKEALARLTRAMQSFTGLRLEVEVIACRWVLPHVDDGFAGESFYSVVLHTGPAEYVVQTMHTEPTSEGYPTVHYHREIVAVGDAFVFDPTTPHMAAPVEPHKEQMLILLQMVVKDRNLAERAALLKRLPASWTAQRRDDC